MLLNLKLELTTIEGQKLSETFSKERMLLKLKLEPTITEGRKFSETFEKEYLAFEYQI